MIDQLKKLEKILTNRLMRFKTLVVQKGTKFQEFFGYGSGNWVTCGSPIHMMNEKVTFEGEIGRAS